MTDPLAPQQAPDGDLFSPVSVGRISEVIVEQIRGLIRGGRIGPGDRLPSERDLCVRFGVSRVTVRDALRILEATGLIEIRVGARGGAFVTAPSTTHVGEGIADLLTMSSLSASAVTEARIVLELGMIPFVCARATEEDLEELAAICEKSKAAVEAGAYSMELSAEFHARLSQASHNGALELLVRSMRGPMLRSLEQSHLGSPMTQHAVHEHEELVEAIRDRDEERATKIMSDHLHRTASRLEPKSSPETTG